MIRIKIGKKNYRGVYSWDDITLNRFYRLAAINIPESYRKWALADGKYNPDKPEEFLSAVEGITDDDIKFKFPAFYQRVISVLTNIPDDVLNSLTNDHLETLYNNYLRHFVFSIIYHVPLVTFMGRITEYRPPDIKVFRLGLRLYYLPASVNISGEEITLFSEPSKSYSEAADIFASMQFTGEDIERFGLFMAIYCRRFREPYNEMKAIRRQGKMGRVKMSVVWSVFFYILGRLPASIKTIRLFGDRPARITELRSAVRTLRNTGQGRSSTKQPVTGESEQSQTSKK